MNTNDNQRSQQASPAAHAALVRIYMDWAGKTELEQIEAIDKGVLQGFRSFERFSPSGYKNLLSFMGDDLLFPSSHRKGQALYGDAFDECFQEAWRDFLEKCSDLEEFADYLQDCSDMAAKQFSRMREKYIQRVFKEWDNVTKDMTENELDAFFETEFPKRMEEFEAKTRNVKLYPTLGDLFRKTTRNKLESERRDRNKRIDRVTPVDNDADDFEWIGDLLEPTPSFEWDIIVEENFKNWLKSLDKTDQIIAEGKRYEYSQKEIAQHLGISEAAVSKRLGKLREKYWG